jgi:hypothetical protein
MKHSDSSLTLRNLAQIGETGCHYPMQTKDKIRKHRAHLAFSTLKISQSQDCKTRWECKFHWEMEWWEGFARLIHHPEITLPFGDIPKIVLDVRDGGMDGVCDGSLYLTIDVILEEGKFQQEAEEIVKAKYQTDEPIRAAFRNISTASSS